MTTLDRSFYSACRCTTTSTTFFHFMYINSTWLIKTSSFSSFPCGRSIFLSHVWHLLYTCELRQPIGVPTSHSPACVIFRLYILMYHFLHFYNYKKIDVLLNLSMTQLCIVHLQEWRKSKWSLLCGQSPALVICSWPVCGHLSLGPTCPQQAASGHRFCGMLLLALL